MHDPLPLVTTSETSNLPPTPPRELRAVSLGDLQGLAVNLGSRKFPVMHLFRNAVHDCLKLHVGKPRWFIVGNIFGLSSVASRSLCLFFECNPDDRMMPEE